MKTHYALFDTLLEPVFILNREGKVVYCNEPASLICEQSVRKISRGVAFKDLLTFSDPIEALDHLDKITDPTPYKETNFTAQSGQKGKVQLTLQPVQNESGDQHWLVFVRDVTLEERLQKKYRAELEQKEDVILALQKAQAELEQYSKNLEKMVEERTEQISAMNRLMKALLDSLSQGFFIFDKNGTCLNVSSRACENNLETKPDGQMIWDVLKLAEKQVEGFKKWSATLFSEMLPFEDLAPLGPATFPHSQGKQISLEYFPLRNQDQQIEGVVVVSSDITSLVEARRQAESEKQYAKLIIHLIRNRNEMGRFIRESQTLFKELHQQMSVRPDSWSRDAIFRCLHTLKGGAALFSVQKMAEACHFAETRLTEYRDNPDDIHADLLKSQCQAVEMQFRKFLEETREILGNSILSEERLLEVPISSLNQLLKSLQGIPHAENVAKGVLGPWLFEPAKYFFEPYKDVAKRVAEKEGKMLRGIFFRNDMIPIVPEIYGPLFATFVHAFRNAVDHGIETPDLRSKAGKPEGGEISLSFVRKDLPSPMLKITLQDDGSGIDPRKIRMKLQERGLDTTKETDQQVIQHIFDSQFSTKDTLTEISGRGVGMDAIQQEVHKLGGKAWVESRLGQGTTLQVEVPYLTEVPKNRVAA